MPTYLYQGYTADGKTRKGRLEALTPKEARERLIESGVYPRWVRGAGGGRGRFTAARRSVFYRELGALLEAGLPLDRALLLLSENPELATGAETLASVADQVKEGGDFSQILGKSLRGVKDDETAVLAAGESAGRLSTVCLELADHLEEESVVAEQIRTALIYPAVVSTLALGVLGVMVGVLLPAYERLLEGMDEGLPAITRAVLAGGAALRHPAGLAVLFALVLGLVAFAHKLRTRPQSVLPRRRFQLPVLGRALSSLARARFARTLALLLEGGVPLQRALETAGRATGSLWLLAASGEAAGRVAHGERLADVLAQTPVLGEDLPGWARAGEASGELAGLMRHAARGHQRAWDRGLRRALGLLEPLLIVAVGVLILLVALAIFLPMLRLNRALLG